MSLSPFSFGHGLRGKDKENPYNARNPCLKESYTTD